MWMSPCRLAPRLPKWVQPGTSFKYNFGAENTYTGREFHVRAIDDGQAVIREWTESAGWRYTVESPHYFRAYGKRIVHNKKPKAHQGCRQMKTEFDITDEMQDIVDFLRDQSEIDLNAHHVSDLLAGDASLLADISEWGWDDTEVQSRIINVVTHRFLGKRWPRYGDAIDLRAFINQLRQAAEEQGFETLGEPVPPQTEAVPMTRKLSAAARSIIEQSMPHPTGAPFIATLVHADGRREDMLLYSKFDAHAQDGHQ